MLKHIAEKAVVEGNRMEQGTLFKITKVICGKTKTYHEDKLGNLLTFENDKKSSWVEHFSEVFNRQPPPDEPNISQPEHKRNQH